MSDTSNLRTLVQRLGISHFNATSMIPALLITPAITDPKSPQIMMLVLAIQKALNARGAAVPPSGYLDVQTAQALERVVGSQWEIRPWFRTVEAVLARGPAVDMTPTHVMDADDAGAPTAVGGILDALPAVPGGMLTYAAGAGLLLYHLFAKRR